jgi:hypothetical protein
MKIARLLAAPIVLFSLASAMPVFAAQDSTAATSAQPTDIQKNQAKEKKKQEKAQKKQLKANEKADKAKANAAKQQQKAISANDKATEDTQKAAKSQ